MCASGGGPGGARSRASASVFASASPRATSEFDSASTCASSSANAANVSSASSDARAVCCWSQATSLLTSASPRSRSASDKLHVRPEPLSSRPQSTTSKMPHTAQDWRTCAFSCASRPAGLLSIALLAGAVGAPLN